MENVLLTGGVCYVESNQRANGRSSLPSKPFSVQSAQEKKCVRDMSAAHLPVSHIIIGIG
jgi:hypothetical protein